MTWAVYGRGLIPLFALVGAVFLFLDTRRMLTEFDPLKQLQLKTDEPKKYQLLLKEKKNGDRNLGEIEWIRKMNSDPLPKRETNLTAEEMCADNSSLYCMPALRKFEAELRATSKYRMSTCVIQKSMSTVMTAIFCFLFDETAFIADNRNLLKEWKQLRFCANKNEFWSISRMARKMKIKPKKDDWAYTMVTRDPVDRFLSGFVDKCIRKPLTGNYCNGCESNMTCFIIEEYKRMKLQVERNKFWRSFEDRHFFPQNWRCELSSHLSEYHFIRYSTDPSDTLLADLKAIMVKRKVPPVSIRFIEKQLTAGRTAHSTVQSDARLFLEKRLRSSPLLMEYLIRMFYYDFKLLNYPFPAGF